ncbi:MAG: formate dehydrogenase accessory protein FdhE [Nitrospirae bacterium]|nr:formate dehydrogenase accessory protein FdhE [Nitrospirota bacterium]
MSTEVRILEPGKIEVPAGRIRFLVLPGQDIFARRAGRFRILSGSHALGDYLGFLALLADAQQKALDQFPALTLPGPDEQALCREHGMPLLSSKSWPRNPAWHSGLRMVLQQMAEAALPAAASETVAGLMHASQTVLEEMADRILAGELADISPGELPFVAAALQVYWVRMAGSLGEDAFGRLQESGLCPVCGSYPSVGIVSAGTNQGLRYLSCSLCSSQWHMVRIKCSNCESTEGINFYTAEGSKENVKVECCSKCNVYLKLLYLEKDPQMDPIADDLATLALDMIMDKEGKSRKGPNLFFHPGV